MILTIILCSSLLIGNETDNIEKLREFYRTGDVPFINYLFESTSYCLEENPQKKFNYGFNAISLAVQNGQYEEAEIVLKDMIKTFPDRKEVIDIEYASLLLLHKKMNSAKVILNNMNTESNERNFLLSFYYHLKGNQRLIANEKLNIIDSSFSFLPEVDSLIIKLNKVPEPHPKKAFIAVSLSAIVPGSGQLYTGYYYEGLSAFGICALTGLAAGTSWLWENTNEKKDRTYILPCITTFIYGLFYVSNLYNSQNLTNRRNAMEEQIFWESERNIYLRVLQNETFSNSKFRNTISP